MYLWVLIAGISIGIIAGIILFFFKKKPEEEIVNEIKNTSFVFSGKLNQINLIEAIQFLEIGRREGILHVYCGRRKGYLTFSDGNVIDAFFRNTTGRDAIFPMLELKEGDFYFEPKKINQPRLIFDSIMDIALEWDSLKEN